MIAAIATIGTWCLFPSFGALPMHYAQGMAQPPFFLAMTKQESLGIAGFALRRRAAAAVRRVDRPHRMPVVSHRHSHFDRARALARPLGGAVGGGRVHSGVPVDSGGRRPSLYRHGGGSRRRGRVDRFRWPCVATTHGAAGPRARSLRLTARRAASLQLHRPARQPPIFAERIAVGHAGDIIRDDARARLQRRLFRRVRPIRAASGAGSP